MFEKRRSPGTRKRRKEIDLSKLPEEEQKEFYKSRMLNYLSRRKTRKETFDYLRKAGCAENMSEELVSFAEDYHFLDDEQYVRDFIHDAVSLHHHSTRQIRYDLMMKGIDRDLLDRVLEEEEPDDQSSAIYLVNKRFSGKTYTKEEEKEQLDKCRNWLNQRGFSYDVISNAIDNLFQKL